MMRFSQMVGVVLAALSGFAGEVGAQDDVLASWSFENGSIAAEVPEEFLLEASELLQFGSGEGELVPRSTDGIRSGGGVDGSASYVLFESTAGVVTLTNQHPVESFHISKFRFSFFTDDLIDFLMKPPDSEDFILIRDFVDSFPSGQFAPFEYSLESRFGPVFESELKPGETIAFSIDSRLTTALDNLEILGVGPRTPPAMTIEAITSIQLLETGTRIEMPIAFRRRIGVEYSTDATPGSWMQLGNFFEEGEVAVFIDPDLTRSGQRSGFYRAFLRPLDHN